MMSERLNHGYFTLLDAINGVKREGFTIEFSVNKKGFYDPENGHTYMPESIRSTEVFRIDAPMSEPDEQSILYLLTTINGERGWISDAYGLHANELLPNHLSRMKENFSCVQ